jgi:aminopeptidase N
MPESKYYDKVIVECETVKDRCVIFTIKFRHQWSVSSYREAAESIYKHMQEVYPQPVYAIADFSHPELRFRKDILEPVIVDKDILKFSVDAPKNRRAVYFVFKSAKLLIFAKLAASGYQLFVDKLLKPEHICTSLDQARHLILAKCADTSANI